ncbi:MAG: hypothetical protein NC408_04495 [Candidatus Gastranaerophilales bacterium]|nr:hypothetical protein [Candidatus Gastranaerophilales bacterium]MCM1072269.1 hypothetical protein [Bacteroides sp.]
MQKLGPDARSQFESFQRMAVQSGNPEQYMMQQLGNNPVFQKVMNIRQNKTPEEFNNYLGNLYSSLNNQNMA